MVCPVTYDHVKVAIKILDVQVLIIGKSGPQHLGTPARARPWTDAAGKVAVTLQRWCVNGGDLRGQEGLLLLYLSGLATGRFGHYRL